MALSPEASVGTGLACAALVYSIHQAASPSLADIRTIAPDNGDIDGTRKTATWIGLGVVSAISLLTKDMTVFIIGGSAVVACDWWTRHANAYDPQLRTALRRDAIEANNAVMTGSVATDIALPGMS